MASRHIPKHMGSIGIGLENTPGTAVDPDASYALPFTRMKIGDEVEMDEYKGPGAGMDSQAQYMVGRDVPVEYDGEVDIDAIGYVLANAYGGYSYAAGTTTHTWDGGDWDPTDADTNHYDRRQPWTAWENIKNLGEGTTKNRKATGVYGSRLEISGSKRKPLTFKVNGFGFKWALDVAASITNVLPSQAPVLHGKGVWTLQVGSGTVHTVVPDEFTVISDEELEGDRDAVQDDNLFDVTTVRPGERKQSITMKLPLRSPYGIDIMNYLAGPRTDTIKIVGTWTVGSKVFVITMDTGMIEGDVLDEITKSKDPYAFNFTFKVQATPLKFDLLNSVAENGYYYQAA